MSDSSVIRVIVGAPQSVAGSMADALNKAQDMDVVKTIDRFDLPTVSHLISTDDPVDVLVLSNWIEVQGPLSLGQLIAAVACFSNIRVVFWSQPDGRYEAPENDHDIQCCLWAGFYDVFTETELTVSDIQAVIRARRNYTAVASLHNTNRAFDLGPVLDAFDFQLESGQRIFSQKHVVQTAIDELRKKYRIALKNADPRLSGDDHETTASKHQAPAASVYVLSPIGGIGRSHCAWKLCEYMRTRMSTLLIDAQAFSDTSMKIDPVDRPDRWDQVLDTTVQTAAGFDVGVNPEAASDFDACEDMLGYLQRQPSPYDIAVIDTSPSAVSSHLLTDAVVNLVLVDQHIANIRRVKRFLNYFVQHHVPLESFLAVVVDYVPSSIGLEVIQQTFSMHADQVIAVSYGMAHDDPTPWQPVAQAVIDRMEQAGVMPSVQTLKA